MIPVANIKNFLFTTRYPPDKILETYTGSFTAPPSLSGSTLHRTEFPIDHTFGDSLFLQTTYSLDGGITWQDQDTSIPDLSTPSQPVFETVDVDAYATSTQIVIVVSNFLTVTKTVTYNVVAMSKT